jgi:hypothetical protein
VSILVLLLAFAALDDITTDRATQFRAEYTMLLLAAAWFGFVAVWLMRRGHRALGMVSLAALAAAFWAQRGIGPGVTPALGAAYLVMAGALLWFLALAVALVVFGVRGAPRS